MVPHCGSHRCEGRSCWSWWDRELRAAVKRVALGADVFRSTMAISEHRSKQPARRLILALAMFLALTAGAVVWVLMQNTASTSSIRLEAEEELLISDMLLAIQVEAERAGAFAGQISGMDMDGPGPGGLLADDMDVRAAVALFGDAAGSLKDLMSDSEQHALENAITAHNDFVASMEALDLEVQSGQDPMSFYHGNTQMLEAVLRTSLQDLQSASSTRLQSAIDEVSSTQTLLRWAAPMLLLAGIVAAVYLVRMQATRRRIATLEELVRAKGEFIASVSHELRTPLTVVVGFADLLRRTGTDLSSSDRAHMVAVIAEQSEEVSAIVEDLLVAARTDMEELTVTPIPIYLRAETTQVLETLYQSDSVAVRGHPPTAHADPARVRQILRNLLTNAKRYGGEKVGVELGRKSDAVASLIVKDDGDPIPTEDRERIFEPYQRARSQPERPGSIGLGLAVSRRLARLMGGDLTYRHEDGHSIFELSLPVTTLADLEPQLPRTAAAR